MTYMRPAQIEKESMRIIAEELKERGIVLPVQNAAVIRRVIHATADFDFAENLVFTPDAVRLATEALKRGAHIVTDTNMALAGVSTAGLERLGGEKHCFMADADVASEAKKRGVTRAVCSVEKAVSLYPGSIYAAGNAPTALFEIAGQIETGFSPALVVAVPVGFVNVTEAKEKVFSVCEEKKIPCIMATGRKGGSTVAAAILNALIYEASETEDPARRGW